MSKLARLVLYHRRAHENLGPRSHRCFRDRTKQLFILQSAGATRTRLSPLRPKTDEDPPQTNSPRPESGESTHEETNSVDSTKRPEADDFRRIGSESFIPADVVRCAPGSADQSDNSLGVEFGSRRSDATAKLVTLNWNRLSVRSQRDIGKHATGDFHALA